MVGVGVRGVGVEGVRLTQPLSLGASRSRRVHPRCTPTMSTGQAGDGRRGRPGWPASFLIKGRSWSGELFLDSSLSSVNSLRVLRGSGAHLPPHSRSCDRGLLVALGLELDLMSRIVLSKDLVIKEELLHFLR